jgi:lipopolysaccharide transport system permease protein
MNNFFRYKYFTVQLVKKHIVNQYKQTILGPSLQILNPFLQSGLFAIVFGKILDVETDGVPNLVYYLVSVTFFNFYRTSTLKSAVIFTAYSQLYKSFYFPKILMSVSIILESIILYFLQFILMLIILIIINNDAVKISLINIFLSIFPLIQYAIVALASGMIISSLTFKYRDLVNFIGYIMQGLFFLTPVIYSSSKILTNYEWFFHINPLFYSIKYFKYLFFGTNFPEIKFLYSNGLITILLIILAFKLFRYADKKFDDFA